MSPFIENAGGQSYTHIYLARASIEDRIKMLSSNSFETFSFNLTAFLSPYVRVTYVCVNSFEYNIYVPACYYHENASGNESKNEKCYH